MEKRWSEVEEKDSSEALEEQGVDKRLVLRELIKNYRVRANMLARRADKRLKRAFEAFDERTKR